MTELNGENCLPKTTKNNQSVEKVLRIIEELSCAMEAMRLQDLSSNLDLNSATTLRYLSTLAQAGYVYQDPETLKYGLTLKLCYLAGNISQRYSVRNIASPYLKELSAACGESICLAVEENMSVVYIDVVNATDQMLKAYQRIGKTAPLYCTGIGKLFLSGYDLERFEKYVASAKFEKFTTHTITTPQALMWELKEVSSSGIAFDNEECEVGAKCLAAPIKDYTGKIVAAISITGPISRITNAFVDKFKSVLLQKARKISEHLGYLNYDNRS